MWDFNFLSRVFILLSVTIEYICAVKLCVTNPSSCNVLKEHNSDVTCVQARDRAECLFLVSSGASDITVASNSELYLAHLLDPGVLKVVAETRDKGPNQIKSHRYEGVAVVRKSTIKTVHQLKGKKSCHTGYWRTAGWHIPINMLKHKKLLGNKCMKDRTTVEQDIKSVSSFFGSACVPGPWTPDPQHDAVLKGLYPSMCSACGSSGADKCSNKDVYSGYTGALECLMNGADVAWTKFSEVENFFEKKTQGDANEYGLLCPDDRVIDLTTNPYEISNCAWASRPWNSWVVKGDVADSAQHESIVKAVSALLEEMEMGILTETLKNDIFGSKKQSVIHPIQPIYPINLLKNANFDKTFTADSCSNPPISLCVNSGESGDKCNLMSKVMAANRIRPALSCDYPSIGEDCVTMVGTQANVVAMLDGSNVYAGDILFGNKAIVTEVYGEHNASYYAVAVVKSSSDIHYFEDLKDKKSCHTGFNKTAGWKMPVAELLEKNLISQYECDFAKSMSSFFAQSCAPGANKLADSEVKEKLCSLCAGDGEDSDSICEKSEAERYYSYSGAFRCLVEKGDVAFVKHTTVPSNTNGRNQDEWAKNLQESDFSLLCPDGGRMPVSEYRQCHIERVPAHMLVIGKKSPNYVEEEARIMFLRAADIDKSMFKIFGKFSTDNKDVIFKDSATGLDNIPSDVAHSTLQRSYNNKLQELNSCEAVDFSMAPPTLMLSTLNMISVALYAIIRVIFYI